MQKGLEDMNVLVVGANGQIGKQVVKMLCEQSEHKVKAMIRRPEQAEYFQQIGAETLVADLEQDVTHTADDCDAVVFTAGSGAHTGPEKTILVDLDGAIKMIEESERANVERFIMVSAFFADDPAKGSEKIRHYNVAKQRADERLQASGLPYTIIRPGRLTNEPGTGKIIAGEQLEPGSERIIPRADVASVVAASLELDNLKNKTFKILSGDTPIREALKRL